MGPWNVYRTPPSDISQQIFEPTQWKAESVNVLFTRFTRTENWTAGGSHSWNWPRNVGTGNSNLFLIFWLFYSTKYIINIQYFGVLPANLCQEKKILGSWNWTSVFRKFFKKTTATVIILNIDRLQFSLYISFLNILLMKYFYNWNWKNY